MGKKKLRKKRESSQYFKAESIEVRHISNGRVVDTQGFKLNNTNDTIKLFELFCDKLGFKYKVYENYKKIDWQ